MDDVSESIARRAASSVIVTAVTGASGVAQVKPSWSGAAAYFLMAEVQGSGLYTASQGTSQITVIR
jgi:hypothetical protein